MPTVYSQASYDANKAVALTIPFATEEYGGAKADITAAANYSDDIDLTTKLGANFDFTFIEIDGLTTTDEIIIQLFRSMGGTWTGNDAPIDQVQYANPGIGVGAKVKTFVIDALQYGPGIYRVSIISAGGTNTFDAKLSGYKWRFEGVNV